MPRPDSPARHACRVLLAASSLVVMTGVLPDPFVGTVLGQERYGPKVMPVPVPVRVTNRQDEQAAKRLYDRVMQEFKRQDYEAALAGYRFFLELYGGTRYAASARYWAGECAYRLGRYEDAIESFSHVLKLSRQKPKLVGATLKMALAYEKLGKTNASRILFERVLNEFSGTPEVSIARKHLGPSVAERAERKDTGPSSHTEGGAPVPAKPAIGPQLPGHRLDTAADGPMTED